MRIVVGVDLEELYRPALDLCLRLKFPDPQLLFTHAVAPIYQFPAGLVPTVIPVGKAMEELHAAGESVVADAKAEACSRDVSAETAVAKGGAGLILMRLADEHKAHLIAIGSGKERTGLASFLGSVARALAISASQSILVMKGKIKGTGPVRAVFATDHSDYANRCLDKLIEWAPQGFSRIDVVTAYGMTDAASSLLKNYVKVELDIEDWVRERTEDLCRKTADKLKAIAAETGIRVEKGHPNTVIRDAMEDLGAELLILGAQGHGFVERLLIGSVSLRQVMAEPYPVLVIRR